MMEHAKRKTGCPGDDVEKQISGGAIEFFHNRADIQQHHHIESDVQQTAMQKACSDQSPPLMENKYSVGIAGAQTIERFIPHAKKQTEPAGFFGFECCQQADGEHHYVHDENDCRDGRVATKKFRKS